MPSRIKTRVAYGRYPALINIANDPIVAQRAPKDTDLYEIGQEWIYETGNQVWVLTSYNNGLPTWTETDTSNIVIGGMPWHTIAGVGPVALLSNNGYSLAAAGAVATSLPAAGVVGSQIIIATTNAGSTGFTIAQGAGQSILNVNDASTVGVAGSLSTVGIAQPYTTLLLICTVADTTWNVAYFNGTTLNLV